MFNNFNRNGLFLKVVVVFFCNFVGDVGVVFIFVSSFDGFSLNVLMSLLMMVRLNGSWLSLFFNFLNLLICCMENDLDEWCCFLLMCMSVSVLKFDRNCILSDFKCMICGR